MECELQPLLRAAGHWMQAAKAMFFGQNNSEVDMNTIRFYSAKAEYGCFSNFSLHSVLIDGVLYQTSEHYFQSQKFSDEAIRKKVRDAITPNEAARLGRDRNFPLRKDWESVKDEIMLKAIRAKAAQHDDFKEMLLSTEDAMIIEHTKNDHYWADGGDGSGKNRLGEILMKVRSEIRENNHSRE